MRINCLAALALILMMACDSRHGGNLGQTQNVASTSIERMAPVAFMAQLPIEPYPFRVICHLDTYFNYDFADASRTHYSVNLEFPDSQSKMHGYLPQDTDAGKQFFELLKDGNNHQATLTLRYLPSTGDASCCVIDDFCSPDWSPAKSKIDSACSLMTFAGDDKTALFAFWDGAEQARRKRTWTDRQIVEAAKEARSNKTSLHVVLVNEANRRVQSGPYLSGIAPENFPWTQVAIVLRNSTAKGSTPASGPSLASSLEIPYTHNNPANNKGFKDIGGCCLGDPSDIKYTVSRLTNGEEDRFVLELITGRSANGNPTVKPIDSITFKHADIKELFDASNSDVLINE